MGHTNGGNEHDTSVRVDDLGDEADFEVVQPTWGQPPTTGRNAGFSVLPKDTLTCRQEEPGFEPLTHGSLADLLYLLSHSHPKCPLSTQYVLQHQQIIAALPIGGVQLEPLWFYFFHC